MKGGSRYYNKESPSHAQNNETLYQLGFFSSFLEKETITLKPI